MKTRVALCMIIALVAVATTSCRNWFAPEEETFNVVDGRYAFTLGEIDFAGVTGLGGYIDVTNRRGEYIRVRFFLVTPNEEIPKTPKVTVDSYHTRRIRADFNAGDEMRLQVWRGSQDYPWYDGYITLR